MAWTEVAAAGVTAAGSLANSGANWLTAKKQRKWSEQMMDKQNAWSVDMYNKLQSPAAQRQQMLDAGINPLSSDMSSGSIPTSAGVNQYSAPSFENPFKEAMDTYLKAKQASNLDSESEKNYAETAQIKGLTPYVVKEAALKNEETHVAIQNMIKSGKLTDEQIKQAEILNKWSDVEHAMTLNKVIVDSNLNKALTSKSEEERNTIKYNLEHLLPLEEISKMEDIEQIKAKTAEIKQNTARLSKETGIAEQDLINYAYNHLPPGAKNITGVINMAQKSNKKQSGWIADKLNKGLTYLYDNIMNGYDLSWD